MALSEAHTASLEHQVNSAVDEIDALDIEQNSIVAVLAVVRVVLASMSTDRREFLEGVIEDLEITNHEINLEIKDARETEMFAHDRLMGVRT